MAKILVVDDEPETCDLLKVFLTRRGHEVATATRGDQAFEKIQRDRPQLILLDIRMPVMDGMELLKKVKALEPAPGIIMISAVQEESIADRTLKEGADDYITKPIDLRDLESRVRATIAGRTG